MHMPDSIAAFSAGGATFYASAGEGDDIDPAAAGDLGPEGIVFIPAADSPSGEAMIAVANEISGTTTLYTVSEVLFRDGFDGGTRR